MPPEYPSLILHIFSSAMRPCASFSLCPTPINAYCNTLSSLSCQVAPLIHATLVTPPLCLQQGRAHSPPSPATLHNCPGSQAQLQALEGQLASCHLVSCCLCPLLLTFSFSIGALVASALFLSPPSLVVGLLSTFRLTGFNVHTTPQQTPSRVL